jgi:hypothetical protein
LPAGAFPASYEKQQHNLNPHNNDNDNATPNKARGSHAQTPLTTIPFSIHNHQLVPRARLQILRYLGATPEDRR